MLAKMQGHDMEKMLGGKTPIKRFIAYMVLPFAMKKHKKLVSGMLKDVQNGRKCEIDFINGVVSKEGARVGVETPLCDKVVELVHGIENPSYIGVYTLDGHRMAAPVTFESDGVAIHLTTCPAGVYIIQINNKQTIKITRRWNNWLYPC